MNLIEVYVTNITSEKKVRATEGRELYRLVADTDGYGAEEKQVALYLNEEEYKSVKEKGYMLR